MGFYPSFLKAKFSNSALIYQLIQAPCLIIFFLQSTNSSRHRNRWQLYDNIYYMINIWQIYDTHMTMLLYILYDNFLTTHDNIYDNLYYMTMIWQFISYDDNMTNTSLAAKGALAHRLQRCTACKIQYGRQGAQKLPTERCLPLGFWAF